jgi:hypothetical protein
LDLAIHFDLEWWGRFNENWLQDISIGCHCCLLTQAGLFRQDPPCNNRGYQI